MPNGLTSGAPTQVGQIAGWTFVDAGGFRKSTNLKLRNSVATGAQVTAVGNAMANLSNGSLIEQRTQAKIEVLPGSAEIEVFDEAYAAASTVAVFVFQDQITRETQRLEVPAPDYTVFLADQETVDTANATVGILIAAALTVFAQGDGDWIFVRGYRSGRSFRASRPRALPANIVEPDAGDLPPALPAP